MFTIRDEQIQFLNEANQRYVDDHLLKHLNNFSPSLFQPLPDEDKRSYISRGIELATKYGFTRRGPIKLYLETLLVFGIDFDIDPQYPWAADSLSESNSTNQDFTAAELHEEIVEYYESAIGENAEYTKAAIRRVLGFTLDTIPRSTSSDVDGLIEWLYTIYPEKSDCSGEDCLRELVQLSAKQADLIGITAPWGSSFYSIAAFAFGSGFAKDPRYPWISETLRKGDNPNINERTATLYNKMMAFLERSIALH